MRAYLKAAYRHFKQPVLTFGLLAREVLGLSACISAIFRYLSRSHNLHLNQDLSRSSLLLKLSLFWVDSLAFVVTLEVISLEADRHGRS
jgi:hypothetical protein